MSRQYLVVQITDGRILGTLEGESPDEGPVRPQESPIAETILVRWDEVFTREGHRDTEQAYLVDAQVVWLETASIGDLREAKNEQINAWKLDANSSYFEFAGKKIAYKESDRVEIQAINNVVTLTGTMPTWPDWPAAWKTLDNTWVPLPDVPTWTAFNIAIAERGTAHFKRAQELKAELASANTAAEIEAITW